MTALSVTTANAPVSVAVIATTSLTVTTVATAITFLMVTTIVTTTTLLMVTTIVTATTPLIVTTAVVVTTAVTATSVSDNSSFALKKTTCFCFYICARLIDTVTTSVITVATAMTATVAMKDTDGRSCSTNLWQRLRQSFSADTLPQTRRKILTFIVQTVHYCRAHGLGTREI